MNNERCTKLICLCSGYCSRNVIGRGMLPDSDDVEQSSYGNALRAAIIRIEIERNMNEFLRKYFHPTDHAARDEDVQS